MLSIFESGVVPVSGFVTIIAKDVMSTGHGPEKLDAAHDRKAERLMQDVQVQEKYVPAQRANS
jgi:hypothetical protein